MTHNKRHPLQTTPRKLSDPGERERVLRVYGGVFPKAIKEFAEKIIPRQKKRTNFAR